MTIEQLRDEMLKWGKQEPKPCPSCGHCPTCGSRPQTWIPMPYQPTPYTPTWPGPGPTWTVTTLLNGKGY